MSAPQILFVPGMKPKPEPAVHRAAILRCLAAALARVDAEVAEALTSDETTFVRINWTFAFYERFRDFELDRAGIEQLLAEPYPSASDRREIQSVTAWLTRLAYRLGDAWPWLSRVAAPATMQETLAEVQRYQTDTDGIGQRVRQDLSEQLRDAQRAGRPILLIGHSLGSVIAWDTLMTLTLGGTPAPVDLFMTLGSPLGNRTLRHGLVGWRRHGPKRYPEALGAWSNFAAICELVALYPHLAPKFREMQKLGRVTSIRDHRITTHFREAGELRVHSEYGYLANDDVARAIAAWFRTVA
ncbi:MAG: hypothetical protein AAGF46_01795 [Pseudomonadota bacterium]